MTKKNYLETFKKCPGLLCFTLLGCSPRKNYVEFPWPLVFDLDVSTKGVSHNFTECLGVKACFLISTCSFFKTPGKSMSSTPLSPMT